jgi:rRNA-processing protein FCF1
MSEVLKNLRRINNDLSNIGNGSADEVLQQYQRWAAMGAESLGYMFPSDRVDRLILTQRHWALVSLVVAYNGAVVHDMIRAERTDRMRVFTAVIQELQALEASSVSLPAKVVAADTNFYLHNEEYFDKVDWHALAGTKDAIRLLVPLAVVRELDKIKRAAKNVTVSDTNKEPIRTRARVTSRRLREAFEDPKRVVTLRPGIEAELLLDPFEHRPIDDHDSEIIDRVLTAQTLTGHAMSIVTNDGGMQFSARTAGLDVIPIFEPEAAGS